MLIILEVTQPGERWIRRSFRNCRPFSLIRLPNTLFLSMMRENLAFKEIIRACCRSENWYRACGRAPQSKFGTISCVFTNKAALEGRCHHSTVACDLHNYGVKPFSECQVTS